MAMIVFIILKLCALAILFIISVRGDILKGRVRNAAPLAAAAAGFLINGAESAYVSAHAGAGAISRTGSPTCAGLPFADNIRVACDLPFVDNIRAACGLPIADALLGFALPFVLLFLLFYVRALGAGDIKLLMAVGGMMGARFMIYALPYAFLAGGALATAAALRRRRLLSGLRGFWAYLYTCTAHRRVFQYGGAAEASAGSIRFTPAICAGAAAALIHSISNFHFC